MSNDIPYDTQTDVSILKDSAIAPSWQALAALRFSFCFFDSKLITLIAQNFLRRVRNRLQEPNVAFPSPLPHFSLPVMPTAASETAHRKSVFLSGLCGKCRPLCVRVTAYCLAGSYFLEKLTEQTPSIVYRGSKSHETSLLLSLN